MVGLETEHQLYLLYARAYTEQTGTITKGAVKRCLPTKWHEKAEKIHVDLQNRGLIQPAQKSKHRFSVTAKGVKELVKNLAMTDYTFDSNKGSKVLNTLLVCIKEASDGQLTPSETMSFEEFEEKFKSLYFEQRKQQSLRGVIAIRKAEMSKIFTEKYVISLQAFDKHFTMLQSKSKISVIRDESDEFIEWVE